MTVAEAMLAGCIPVVTSAGALPEVVGDTGVVVESPDPAAVAAGVNEALGLPEDARSRARERVLDRFPLEVRRRGLLQAGGRGSGGTASRSRSASLSSTSGLHRLLEPRLPGGVQRRQVALPHLLGRHALLEPVVARHEEPLDRRARRRPEVSMRQAG